MEVSGVVFRPLRCYSGAGIDAAHSYHSSSMKPSVSVDLRLLGHRDSSWVSAKPVKPNNRRLKFSGFAASGFCDNGHEQYYNGTTTTTSTTRCGAGKKGNLKEKEKGTTAKKMKKKLKLLKGLSKNLSNFSEIGFGLADQVKGQMISEAAEELLGQLQQLRAEEMEMKSKKKEEKAKLKLKQSRMMDCEVFSSSSSSSSESSDSECGEVVDMSRLKSETHTRQNVVNEETTTLALPSSRTELVVGSTIELQPVAMQIQVGDTVEERGFEVSGQNCSSTGISNVVGDTVGLSSDKGNSLVNIEGGSGSGLGSATATKIEVCMGSKCKKSGAASLLEEFQKVVGGGVVGCKCMGKCRDGPNVRVFQKNAGDVSCNIDSIRTSRTTNTNPLCIGVGLEDVGLIVYNFFGGSDLGVGTGTGSA